MLGVIAHQLCVEGVPSVPQGLFAFKGTPMRPLLLDEEENATCQALSTQILQYRTTVTDSNVAIMLDVLSYYPMGIKRRGPIESMVTTPLFTVCMTEHARVCRLVMVYTSVACCRHRTCVSSGCRTVRTGLSLGETTH
jgi:hypothetical protein